MFFTVVIPSHQRKEQLTVLLDSLAAQTFKDFEVRIIATENDPAFELQNNSWPFPIHFHFVDSDPSHGKSASIKRNFGAKLAQGSWIAFTDDDCIADQDWLLEAKKTVDAAKAQFIEGNTHIPEPKLKTFTYKGIRRLSRPGGFQTCNMFYKKSDFMVLGGFDLNFPFYLEDTDLAWTFLENNKAQAFAEKATVSHPVPEAAPHKMLESAWRMEKLPYLYKKHPQTFKKSNMRALPRPYLVLALVDLLLIVSLFVCWSFTLGLLMVKLILSGAVLWRMLRHCHWSFKEMLAMYYYLLVCPLISLFALIKGNIRQGVWIFLR